MKISTPQIDSTDINSIHKVLKSNWISTSSNVVKEFEKKICKYVKTKYCLALNSGTTTIHLALKIIGVKENDEILLPSISFVGSVNPVLYLKAKPVFFDVDENNNLKINDLLRFLSEETYFKNNNTYNKKTKNIIKAIIIVHMWGNPCDFIKIKKICKKNNIKIIEDAAEALGSTIKISKNKFLNCGVIGDIGCFSFNANKIITTASGGALVTNNKKYYQKASYLANQAKDDTYNYIHNECGYNYKMTGINAGLGVSQLSRIRLKINKRKKIFHEYKKNFKNIESISLNESTSRVKVNHWINILYFHKSSYEFINDLSKYLKKFNIETRRIWRPLHLQKYLTKYQTYKVKNSTLFYNNSICLPSDERLKISEIKKICTKIKLFYKRFYKLNNIK